MKTLGIAVGIATVGWAPRYAAQSAGAGCGAAVGGGDGGEEAAYQPVDDYLQVALCTERGVIPSWSRPGVFLMWFGPIPVRCTWGGIFGDVVHMEAADETALWWSRHATVTVGQSIYRGMKPVRDLLAGYMTRALSAQDARDRKGRYALCLKPLAEAEAMAVADYRRSHRWPAEALRKGPVDPVPMPEELLLAQPPLMV